MKIAILSDFFSAQGDIGGTTPVLYSFAEKLKSYGHEVAVITAVQKGVISPREIGGMAVYSIYSNYNLFWRAYRSLYNPQTVKSIAKIIEEIKPDVVHAHNIHTHLSYYALKIAKKSGAKVFLTAHDVMLFHYGKFAEIIDSRNPNICNLPSYKISAWKQFWRYGKTYNPFRNLAIRHYLKYADKVFTISKNLQKALIDNGIETDDIIDNGINIDDWRPNYELIDGVKSRYNLGSRKVILFGQGLSEIKGSREICAAMKQVVKEAPESVLLVTGKPNKGADRRMLDMAENMGIDKNIIIASGLKDDWLKAALFSSDLTVVPSVYLDPIPRINLEAMAAKKPIIGTCIGGTKEAVIDGATGFIVNPFDNKEMANKIIYLLKNPEIAKKFGEAGYDRVKSKFNLEKMTQKYLYWYEKS